MDVNKVRLYAWREMGNWSHVNLCLNIQELETYPSGPSFLSNSRTIILFSAGCAAISGSISIKGFYKCSSTENDIFTSARTRAQAVWGRTGLHIAPLTLWGFRKYWVRKICNIHCRRRSNKTVQLLFLLCRMYEMRGRFLSGCSLLLWAPLFTIGFCAMAVKNGKNRGLFHNDTAFREAALPWWT